MNDTKADILEDLAVCQYRWRKALREEKFFRAESWRQRLDGLLDQLQVVHP